MRLTSLTFDGYGSGETDFGTLINNSSQAELGTLLDIVQIIVGLLTNPVPNQFLSIIITGHSDRQDRTDLNCDQRRASEVTAARDRAISAWDWIKQMVSSKATQAGIQVGEWWETSPHITWGMVYAAAGMLQFDSPSDEERKLNRRVVMLISIFNPQ